MNFDPQQPLSPISQAILAQQIAYHSERLRIFEQTQAQRSRIPELYDGRYSITRLLHGAAEDRVHIFAPHELEVSKRIAEEVGREPRPGYYFVPYDRERLARRDLTEGVAGAGGFLVGTETAPGNVFIGALLAQLRAVRRGMQVIGLQGNASLPRLTGSITAYWLSTEGTQLTKSDIALAVAALTPKHVGGYAEISDQWLKQTSPAAQNLVLSEMARAVSIAVMNAIANGAGGEQLLGILNTPGIGSVAGTSFAWSTVLDILHAVENANAVVNPQSLGWALPATTAKLVRGRVKETGGGRFLIDDDNRMAGAPVDVTNAMPAATALFGDWSALALAEWGVLEVGADPYGVNSALFNKAMTGVRVLWACDLAVLRPASFCKSESIS